METILFIAALIMLYFLFFNKKNPLLKVIKIATSNALTKSQSLLLSPYLGAIRFFSKI